jgi:chromosome segregation ATPase
MSDYNSTATSTIYVNGKPAEAELQKLKQRASDLKDAIAAAAKAGDKADLRKLRGELTSTKREVKNVENAIHSCEVVMKRLDKATPKELNMALKQLKRELNDMERGTAAWDKQVAKIKRVKAELDSVNAEMKEHQGVLSRLNDGFNK